MRDESIPTVSVIIGCRNVERYIDDAIWSARRQTLSAIEIIVVDDHSADATVARAEWHADHDSRVRVVRHDRSLGPAGARNTAFEAARGVYLAILDGDDFMHPRRLETLVREAQTSGAEIVADDLFAFHDDPQARRPYLLVGAGAASVRDISPAEFILSNRLFIAGPVLGYLKPLIRRDFIAGSGLAYNPALTIAEDYHLLLDAMAMGARLRLISDALYFYRRHNSSISFRLRDGALKAMAVADDSFRERNPDFVARYRAELDLRRNSLAVAESFEELVAALKRREFATALKLARLRPAALHPLAKAAVSGLRRRLGTLFPARGNSTGFSPDRHALLVSRQRVVGATNGSSAYLLALANALKKAGFTIDLVIPSPVMMGRWPWLKLQPEMAVFRSIAVRGCLRFGDIVLYPSPGTAIAAARTVLARLFGRVGLTVKGLDPGPAAYAIAAPWKQADQLYLARNAAPARIVIADYVFQLPVLPYALQPRTPAYVVMHDLFFRRDAQFRKAGSADSVALISESDETALMSLADVVVAIQQDEAEFVRDRLPETGVVVAPMGSAVAGSAAPGQGASLLFVGSNTAPNIVGLRWFLDEAWPAIRAAHPTATLRVAGSVAAAFGPVPDGVEMLGVVPDLAPFYRDAAVVISPLTAGSGLKIKLVEAMAAGKAIVATSVTLQGVEDIAGGAVARADAPLDFAAAVTALLAEPDRRLVLGEAARRVAEQHFSPEAASRAFIESVLSATPRPSLAAPVT